MSPAKMENEEIEEISKERHDPYRFGSIVKRLVELINKQRGMIFSQMNAIGYAGVNIMAYEAGLYLPASEVPMWNSLGVFVMTSLVILIKKPSLPSSLAEVILTALTGMFIGGGGICVMLAIILVNPGDAIAIYFTVPVVCTFYGIICCGERFSIYKIVLVVLAVVGVSFVSGPTFIFEDPFSHDRMYSLGLVVALLGSINYGTGFTILHYTSVRFDTDPFIFTLSTSVFGTVFAAAFAFTLENPVFPTEAHVWVVLITCSCFSFFGGISLSFALSAVSASFVSIATTTEMLYTYLAQFIIFAIKPTWFSVLGAVMILVSCIGLNFIRTEKEENGIEKDDSDVEPLIKEQK